MVVGALPAAEPKPDFTHDILPILQAKCQGCLHGPKVQMHGLRLDVRSAAFKGGETGVPAIVPGKSSQSLLIKYVSAIAPAIVMPPAGPPLKPAEISLLTAWIDSGAEWPGQGGNEKAAAIKNADHWSFQPVSRPPVPAIHSPWIRNPIDAFILQNLQARGWIPAPPVRLRHFCADCISISPDCRRRSRSRSASAKTPIRPPRWRTICSRPAYGERWARHWLDLVRYAETNGYEREQAETLRLALSRLRDPRVQ